MLSSSEPFTAAGGQSDWRTMAYKQSFDGSATLSGETWNVERIWGEGLRKEGFRDHPQNRIVMGALFRADQGQYLFWRVCYEWGA